MLDIEVLEAVEAAEVQSEKVPSYNHSFICSRIMRQLLPNENIEVMPELSLAIGNGITPDISIYPREAVTRPDFLQDIIRYDKLPDLAIEVISVSQSIQDLLDKSRAMVQAGVKNVWTIEPFGKTIFVTTEKGVEVLHNATVESAGVKVDFAKIFNG